MKFTLGPYFQYIAAIIVAATYSSVGTQRGWASPMIPRLLGNETLVTCSNDHVSWMVSARSLSKMVCTVLFYFTVNRVGRKVLILASCVPALVSWLVVAFATSCDELIAARVLDGLAGTVLYVVPSIYISEISRDDVRGFFLMLKELAETVSDLLIASVAPHVSYQTLALICATFPVVGFITVFWLPESPYYDLLKDRDDLAENSLRRLRGVDDVSKELRKMRNFVDRRSHVREPKFLELMNTPKKRLSLAIGVVLLVSLLWSGNIILGEYKTLVFRLSSTGNDEADTNAIILIVVQLLSSVLTALCVDRFGRRPLLIFSCTVCCLSMTLGASSFYWEAIPSWLPIAWTTVFISGYTFGLGSLPWAICSEIFPAELKLMSVTCLSFFSALAAAIAFKMIPVIIEAFGVAAVLWCSVVVVVLTLVIVVLYVPETKSKPFAEIQEDLDAITKRRTLCCRKNEE